jgi:hypothetical protein
MIANVLNATDLSYHVGELPDRDSYLNASAACLRAALAGDLVAWNNIAVARHSADVWFDTPDANIASDTLIAAMSNETVFALLAEHPILRRYLAHANDTVPLRIQQSLQRACRTVGSSASASHCG